MHYSSGTIVLSILGAMAAIVLFVYLPRRISTARLGQGEPTDVPEVTFVGGGTWATKWWPMSATWPLVRFEVFDWGIRIGPNYRWISWFVPVTEVRWEDIESATTSRIWGVKVRTHLPIHWVSFTPNYGLPMARNTQEVVSALRAHGLEME